MQSAERCAYCAFILFTLACFITVAFPGTTIAPVLYFAVAQVLLAAFYFARAR